MDYLVWLSNNGSDFCVINEPDIEKKWELSRGIPRLHTVSSPVRCKMDPEFPKAIRLSDNLYGATVPVISRRARSVLESIITDRVEYLPTEVVNHKGRTEEAEYFILHPIDFVDCIDIEASEIEWNSISPDRISGCEQLILKNEAIAEERKLFRPTYWGNIILARADVAEELKKAGLTGLFFMPTQEYTGIE